MEKILTLKDILANNGTDFVDAIPPEESYALMGVDMLYKLTIIGLTSTIDQMGLEVGQAAASELARRAQLATEVLRRLPQDE